MENSGFLEYAHMAVDYGIIGILVIMSIASLTLFIERMMSYGSVRIQDYENKEELELDLGNNVTTIATIGSNAPYVGLLGTEP